MTLTKRNGKKNVYSVTQRKDYILKQLNKAKVVRISRLSQELGVTRETIRKDLYELAEDDLAKIIRGEGRNQV